MSASTSAEPVRSRRRTGRFLIASASLSQPPRVLVSSATLTNPRPLMNTRRLTVLRGLSSAKSFGVRYSIVVSLLVGEGGIVYGPLTLSGGTLLPIGPKVNAYI